MKLDCLLILTHFKDRNWYNNGRRSSVGRALGCGSSGRGFNPRRLPH